MFYSDVLHSRHKRYFASFYYSVATDTKDNDEYCFTIVHYMHYIYIKTIDIKY